MQASLFVTTVEAIHLTLRTRMQELFDDKDFVAETTKMEPATTGFIEIPLATTLATAEAYDKACLEIGLHEAAKRHGFSLEISWETSNTAAHYRKEHIAGIPPRIPGKTILVQPTLNFRLYPHTLH